MIEKLAAMYRKGAITADHLIIRSLQLLDGTAPGLVLGTLPAELLARALEFTRNYRPGGMATNYGSVPSPEQVAAARRWLEKECRELSQPAWSSAGPEKQRDSA